MRTLPRADVTCNYCFTFSISHSLDLTAKVDKIYVADDWLVSVVNRSRNDLIKGILLYQKAYVSTQLYLCACFSQAAPVERPASLFCGKSYTRFEGEARVNGTGQRSGQSRVGHASDSLPTHSSQSIFKPVSVTRKLKDTRFCILTRSVTIFKII